MLTVRYYYEQDTPSNPTEPADLVTVDTPNGKVPTYNIRSLERKKRLEEIQARKSLLTVVMKTVDPKVLT